MGRDLAHPGQSVLIFTLAAVVLLACGGATADGDGKGKDRQNRSTALASRTGGMCPRARSRC
jgi:hypothetical protein